MSHGEFVTATAIVLFVAFLIGWFANWLVHRMTRVSQADLGELDAMAQATHDAEEARDEAVAYLRERETEMLNRQHQLESELRASLESLRGAREEADELRDYIERMAARR